MYSLFLLCLILLLDVQKFFLQVKLNASFVQINSHSPLHLCKFIHLNVAYMSSFVVQYRKTLGAIYWYQTGSDITKKIVARLLFNSLLVCL